MYITRNNQTIALTPEEVLTAYREQQHAYSIADAEAQFYTYIGTDPYDINIDGEPYHKEILQDFRDTYGFSVNEATDANCECYLLELFVGEFERSHDCDCDENSMWQAAIEFVLEQTKADYRKKMQQSSPRPTYICPQCKSSRFVVTAHVCQDWMVDKHGDFESVLDECSQVTHKPDNEDIWNCIKCGFSGTGEDFLQKENDNG